MSKPLVKSTREGRRCTLTIMRGEVHNAFNDQVIAQLHEGFSAAEADGEVRVIVLASEGRSFCAGADLAWMRAMATYSEEDNVADSHAMAAMFDAVDRCAKPVIARVQGAAVGGGVGLAAAADVTIGSHRAFFQLSEVRLGLAPAVIARHVIGRIGASEARRYFLTGERMDSSEAMRIGLLHRVVDASALDAAVDETVKAMLLGAPRAQEMCKVLAQTIGYLTPEEADEEASQVIAGLRVGPEGQEGMRAFFEKRAPSWREEEGS